MIRIRMNILAFVAASLVAGLLTACGPSKDASRAEHAHEHEESGTHQDEASETGPHGGHLLAEGDLVLEVVLVESPAGAEMRIFPSHDGEPVAPASIRANVKLTRLGGEVEAITFTPKEDYLKSDATIREPTLST